MSSEISAQERAAIDQALSEGRVTVYPQGYRALDESVTYDPKTGRLLYADKEAAKQRSGTGSLYRNRNGARAAPRPHAPRPAKKLAEPKQAAEPSAWQKVGEANREKVRAAFDGKRTSKEIADYVGLKVHAVRSHLSALGLTAPVAKAGPKPRKDTMARRAKVKALADAGKTVREIGQELGRDHQTIRNDAIALGIDIPAGDSAKRSRSAAIGMSRAIRDLAGQGVSIGLIADQLGVAESTVRYAARRDGIEIPKAKRGPNTGSDRAAVKKQAAASKKVAEVKDRRRFKTTPVPTGTSKVSVDLGMKGTRFPTRVMDPSMSEPVLKDGRNQSKIGGDVLVGWLKGAKILTLTLEERATCPDHCQLWTTCYGNGMQHARRWRHGADLMLRASIDLAEACAAHDKVLVRLHVLGDFWSHEYVAFWGVMLTKYPNLHVFGFTAHGPDSDIGSALSSLRENHPHRVWIRHSGLSGPWGSFTIDFPTDRKRIGDAVVCPEQRDAMSGGADERHCGNCAVCWSSDSPVVFIEH